MPNIPITLAAAAALTALPLAGFAQMRVAAPSPAAPSGGPVNPPTESPPASQAAPTANTGSATNTNATTPALSAGMTVKDNTGAAIGQISKLDTDSGGVTIVTIKMGSDAFQLPAARLALQDGAATINLTQAQIATQLHPKK